jgi:SET domain-containing protein
VVDPSKAGNMLRYINDRQDMEKYYRRRDFPNVQMVEVEDRSTYLPHMIAFAMRKIGASEELILDYGNVNPPPSPVGPPKD